MDALRDRSGSLDAIDFMNFQRVDTPWTCEYSEPSYEMLETFERIKSILKHVMYT